MKLFEIMNSSASIDIEQDHPTQFIAFFEVGEWEYKCGVVERKHPTDPQKHTREFYFKGRGPGHPDWTTGETGSGNALLVFSTVWQVMQYYLHHHKPDSFYFSADGESRVNIYRRLYVNKILKFGYKIAAEDKDTMDQHYWLLEK